MFKSKAADFTAFFRDWSFKSNAYESFALLKLDCWNQGAAVFWKFNYDFVGGDYHQCLFVRVEKYSDSLLCFGT